MSFVAFAIDCATGVAIASTKSLLIGNKSLGNTVQVRLVCLGILLIDLYIVLEALGGQAINEALVRCIQCRMFYQLNYADFVRFIAEALPDLSALRPAINPTAIMATTAATIRFFHIKKPLSTMLVYPSPKDIVIIISCFYGLFSQILKRLFYRTL